MFEDTEQQLRDWSPAKEQASLDDFWRRMPEWREATFAILERSFPDAFLGITVASGRRTYELESEDMAELITDCLRCAGARVGRPEPCIVVSW